MCRAAASSSAGLLITLCSRLATAVDVPAQVVGERPSPPRVSGLSAPEYDLPGTATMYQSSSRNADDQRQPEEHANRQEKGVTRDQ